MLETTLDAQDNSQKYAHDARLFVTFYSRPTKAGALSEAAGRPIFQDIEHVRIMVPGDKTTVIDVAVEEEHRMRFPTQYEKFKKQMSQAPDGTPLEQWPQLVGSQVMELKALGILNVEQLAELSDASLQKFMGGFELKRKAVAFLAVAKDTAEAQKFATENAELKETLAELRETLKLQGAQIEALRDVNSKTPPASDKEEARGGQGNTQRR
jgi:hypothetical protein